MFLFFKGRKIKKNTLDFKKNLCELWKNMVKEYLIFGNTAKDKNRFSLTEAKLYSAVELLRYN